MVPLRHGMLSLPAVLVEPTRNQEQASGLSGGGLGIPPSSESYQEDAAVQVMVCPHQATSTFVVTAEDEEGYPGDHDSQLPLRVQAM